MPAINTASLVVWRISCRTESWPSTSSLSNEQGPLCLCNCNGVLLSAHASGVVWHVSCLSESWPSASPFFNEQGPLRLCTCLCLLLSARASPAVWRTWCLTYLHLLLSACAFLVVWCISCLSKSCFFSMSRVLCVNVLVCVWCCQLVLPL